MRYIQAKIDEVEKEEKESSQKYRFSKSFLLYVQRFLLLVELESNRTEEPKDLADRSLGEK